MDNKGMAGRRCRRVDNGKGDRSGGNGGTAVVGHCYIHTAGLATASLKAVGPGQAVQGAMRWCRAVSPGTDLPVPGADDARRRYATMQLVWRAFIIQFLAACPEYESVYSLITNTFL